MSSRTWLRSWLPTAPRTPARRPRPRLAAEQLEARDVPSVAVTISSAEVKEQGNLSTLVPGNASVLEHPSGLAFGPDRTGDGAADLYAVGRVSNNIVAYDGRTGAFVQQVVPAGSGLNGSAFLAVGPDGDLFTSTHAGSTTDPRDTILRVDHATQAVSTFVPTGYGGLAGAKGMAFGPDGNFYVANGGVMEVLRYDGTTGEFMGAFVTAGSAGLTGPAGLAFGPDRNGDTVRDLYVASNGTNQVLAYSGADGTPLGPFVAAGSGGLAGPNDMRFGPDGNLYVVASATSYEQVFRFDGVTGAFIDIPVAAGSGLDPETAFIAFDPEGALCVSGESASTVLRLSAGPLVTLSDPSTDPVTVDFSTAAGTATPGGDYGPVRGRLTFAPGERIKRILVSAVDDGVAELSETLTVTLANAVGADIVGGPGTVTIVNSQTKFFVVNDDPSNPGWAPSPIVGDRTYRYESGGGAIVSNALGWSTAPRGVASNAAGTRLWVVNANNVVRIYDSRNVQLGAWSAGGLHTGQVTGIATNGTDIWLVDGYRDKVYRYPGAASRLPDPQLGEVQNASGSFSLDRANANPQDIATDGTAFWVVDGTALKVFKYSLAGKLLGSWGIDPANRNPTGITVNPAGASDIWIVDNVTLKVYQYIAAAGRTSGSQAAAATFALAPGNTNPQGIADPPAADPGVQAGTTVAAAWFADPAGRPEPAADPPAHQGQWPRPVPAAAAGSGADTRPPSGGRPRPAVEPASAPSVARVAPDWIPGEFDYAPIDVTLPLAMAGRG